MKKAISLILVLLMIFSLAACGETSTQPTQNKPADSEPQATVGQPTDSTTPTQEPTQAPTQAPTEPPCTHSFSEATCTDPSVCALCGATGAEALGHAYSDATCTEAKTCSRCGVTDGDALGHNRVDGTCQRCGHTLGDLNPLWPAVWVIASFDGNNATRVSFVFADDAVAGVIQLANFSTSEEGYGEYWYYNDTSYFATEYIAFAQFSGTGDEYAMTITVTTEDGTTGTISLERIDAWSFRITAVSGTILNKTATNILTVGGLVTWCEMYG